MSGYTHKFELKLDGVTVSGEMEFNMDGVMSYKTDEPIEGFTLGQAEVVNRFFNSLKEVFDAFGGLEKVEITEK